MNTNTKTIVALAAVVAISAILVGSVIAQDAMAGKCRHRGHNGGGGGGGSQSISQAAVSGNGGQSQNIANQQSGSGNSAAIVGIQNRD